MNLLNRAERALVMVLVILVMSGCSSAPQIASRWRTDAVKIDGKATEWEHVPVYAENQKFTVSAQHDSEYLYLCLTTKDRDMQMQLRFSGLIVWFDRDGGKKKDFGINYPLGIRGGEPPSVEDRGKRDPGTEGNPEPMIDPPDRGISSIDILGPGDGDRYRLSTVEHSGVQVKMGRSEQELLVYELQVPLKKSHDHPYAIEARAGVPVGIGIVTATTEKDMRGPERLGPQEGGEGGMGGPPPGGMGGGMGGGPPGGRGGGPGGRGARGGPAGRPEPLDFWMKLTLNVEQK